MCSTRSGLLLLSPSEVLWWPCLCVCVCLSVCPRAYLCKFTPHHHKILCMLPTAMAQSSSAGDAISYILPVLWMTSYLHIMDRMHWEHPASQWPRRLGRGQWLNQHDVPFTPCLWYAYSCQFPVPTGTNCENGYGPQTLKFQLVTSTTNTTTTTTI